MPHFRTIIEVEAQEQKMNYNSRLLFMGSCFADNIGSYFSETGFNAMVNPFGVLYNPVSIAGALKRLIQDHAYSNEDLVMHNQIWQSFDHHSQFNHEDRSICLDNINQSLHHGADFLKKTNYLFITFGTSWVYQLKETGKIVSNCHKFPASRFNRFLTGQQQIFELYSELLTNLKTFNPQLKIILTVSPVRHWKDGAHGNQISKSILLLAIEELRQNFDHLFYFPAYELLLDDLRDYRFFAGDMLHPSPAAVGYIRAKFKSAWINKNGHDFIKNMEQIKKALAHRPFNIHSQQHQQFIQKNISKLDTLQKQFPDVDLNPYKLAFKAQLDNK